MIIKQSTLAFWCSMVALNAGLTLGFLCENPSLAGEATTLSQKNVLFAWKNLGHFIEGCLMNDLCGLSREEAALLAKILADLPRSLKETEIQFLSAREKPGLFDVSSGTHRLAVTGNQIGSPVFFNSDLLQDVGPEADSPALSVLQAVGVLVHELGHHQGLVDTPENPLETLGAKIRGYAEKTIQTIRLDALKQPQMKLFVHNLIPSVARAQQLTPSLGLQGSLFWLSDTRDLEDVSAMYRNAVGCPARVRELVGFSFTNPRWEETLPWDVTRNGQGVAARLDIEVICRQPGSTDQSQYKAIKALFRVSYFISPFSGSNAPGWWRTQRGRILMDELELGIFQKNLAGLRDHIALELDSSLEVENLTEPNTQVQAGESWTVEARVKTRSPVQATGCQVDLSSPQFMAFVMQPRHLFPARDCQLKKIDDLHYQIRATYSFPARSPSRRYQVESVALLLGDEYRIEGMPTFVPAVDVVGPAPPPESEDFGIILYGLNTKMPEVGTWKPVEATVDAQGVRLFVVEPGAMANLGMKIRSKSPIKKESSLFCTVWWRPPGYTWDVATAALIRIDEKVHDLPFKNKSSLASHEYGWDFFFALQTPAPSEEKKFTRESFSTLYLINEDLEEFYTAIPVDVITR